MKTKVCSCCRKRKYVKFFHQNLRAKSGFASYCKKCAYIEVAKWRRKNPGRGAQNSRQSRYGIGPEEYTAFLVKQNGVCAICNQPETRIHCGKVDSLSVDHNHKTNKIRGLLCYKCNTAISFLRDDFKIIEKAAAYVRQHRKN